jgi:hypothetical protein
VKITKKYLRPLDFTNFIELKKKTKIPDAYFYFYSPEGMFDEKDPTQSGQKQE